MSDKQLKLLFVALRRSNVRITLLAFCLLLQSLPLFAAASLKPRIVVLTDISPTTADSAGKRIHVICEVTDNGTPSLTSYRRIIMEPIGTPPSK